MSDINTSIPGLAQIINLLIRNALAEVETSMPGRITGYNHEDQRASVQPLLRGTFRSPDGTRTKYALPVIHNCPVLFFAAGHASLTNKLEVGDRVTCLFGSRDMAGWLTNDSDNNDPQDPRRHNIDDCIVVPGVRSFANPLPAGAVSDTDTVLAADAIQLGSSAASMFIVLDELLTDWINDKIVAGFNDHVHGYYAPALPGVVTGILEIIEPTTGPASSVLPPNITVPVEIPDMVPDDINSDKVRSE